MQSPAHILLMLIVMAAGGGLPAAMAQESPKDIIAAQIRDQGYKCDSPQSADQDMQASKPDEAVWIIRCEDATYRVRLVPDMAAAVERIDKGGDKQQ
jgi:hypothetical protein